MNRLRRYSGGGYNNPYYMDPSRTGWQSPTSAQTPNTGVADTGPKVSGNQIAGYIGTGVGAVAGAVTAGMNTQANVKTMEAANRLGQAQNLANAKTRVQGMRTSGNQYGTYGIMYGQYGGAVLGYGSGSALSPRNAEGGLGFGGANLEYGNSNPGLAKAAGAAGIGRGVSDAALTSVPGWGQAYGAAKQVSTGIQSSYGTEWRETESGDIREVYGSEGDTSSEAQAKGALGNLWKPAHEHAMESFERGDIGEGILDLTGLSTIGRMVEGASDAEDARSARTRFARENSRTMGGTTGGEHLNNQQLANRAMQERDIPVARYGGYPMYKAGGMAETSGVPRYKANAELEDNEIVMKKGGSRDIKIDGPTHEQGGVPMKLEKGDYVWSDHLKDPQSGMSMAQLYEKLSKSNAPESEIRKLMQYQEALAGREPQMRNGGLMKYQNGTPPALSPFIQNPNMTAGQIEAYNKLREQKRTGTVSAAASAQKKASAVNKPKAVEVPPSPPPYDVLGDYATINGPGLGYIPPSRPRPDIQTMTTADFHPLDGYPGSPGSPEQIAATKSKPDYLKYAPEAISGLGSLAAIIATATQDFDKVPIPQANHVKADRMFLDRISPEADIARSQQDFRAMLNATLRGGQGPGASSTAQEAYSAKVRADEQARANADRLNIQIDATEKAGNIDSKLKADSFNEENMARYREMAFAQDTASKAFEREKTQAIVNQILQGTQAVADTAMNRRYAEAVSGDTKSLERFKGTSGLSKELEALIALLNKK